MPDVSAVVPGLPELELTGAQRVQLPGCVFVVAAVRAGPGLPVGGGSFSGELDDVADRYSEEELRVWLKAPEKVKPGTTMPNLGLSDAVIEELVAFLKKRSAK
mgnify:CR=1 FL=1